MHTIFSYLYIICPANIEINGIWGVKEHETSYLDQLIMELRSSYKRYYEGIDKKNLTRV